eukprot:PITA_13784
MLFFKNVKIKFWDDAILCVAYIKNRCPSNAIRNNTPYEMWYGHVPSVKHLRVFGSTCYALIPKVHRNKLGARSCKCIFLGFAKEKSFQEFDNHITHLEGGIPILDQHVESSSEEDSPSHENPTMDDALNDVIDRIGRLNLDSVPTQSTEQPGPSKKGPPKWVTKIIESFHPDEVGKIGTRNSNRQNGDFEPTSFKEAASHDEWKEAMQKEYDALIKNDTWKLVDPP